MSDLVQRLRKVADETHSEIFDGWCREAADEIESQDKQIDALLRALQHIRKALGLSIHSNDDLLEVIAQLRADAERYRWLRALIVDNHENDIHKLLPALLQVIDWPEFDAAIDAQRAGEKG